MEEKKRRQSQRKSRIDKRKLNK